MKRLSILLCILTPLFAWAGPFGFEKGMTRGQIIAKVGSSAVLKEAGDLLLLTTAPNPHPDFDLYILLVPPQAGLVKVAAKAKVIENDAYGALARRQYLSVRDALAETYGKYDETDQIRESSIWKGPRDWMTAVYKGERALAAFWDKPDAFSAIESIFLEVVGLEDDRGYIKVSYEFTGCRAYLEELKKQQNKVF